MIAARQRAAWDRLCIPLAALLFAGCVWLYTRHNDFPFFYHPDEPDKVAQILQDKWNFHHPALMLAAAKAVVKLFRVPLDEQHIVMTGRSLSAIYSAIAVTSLALLAWRMRGPLAFAAVGLFAGLHHQVFELAHYFKEDAALLMGVALTFLALHVICERRTRSAVVFLGVACGLSLSAKYIGLVMLVPALLALWRAPRDARKVHLLIFLTAFVVMTALANYPLLTHLQEFKQSFSREVSLAATGQRGMTHRVPNTEYFPIFAQNMNPALWLFLAVFIARFWRERKQHDFTLWAVAIFPFAYALLLACSPKSNDRYFLPATALFAFAAALGLIEMTSLFRKTNRAVSIAICLLFAAAFQLFSLVKYDTAFAHDDRRELSEWLRTSLPVSAVLAQDGRVGLPAESGGREERRAWQVPIPQRVLGTKLTGTSLDDLRAQGVTHVVISESDYGRFFRKGLVSREGFQGENERQRAFYAALQHGEKLWSRPRGTVIYLHPGLEVYRLPSG